MQIAQGRKKKKEIALLHKFLCQLCWGSVLVSGVTLRCELCQRSPAKQRQRCRDRSAVLEAPREGSDGSNWSKLNPSALTATKRRTSCK